MSEKPQGSEIAFMLGRIQGDVKHILDAITAHNKRADKLEAAIGAQEKRMDKIEKFQVKVGVIMAIATPILLTGLTFGVRFLFGV